MTIIGIVRNAYILGNQIENVENKVQHVKDKLEGQIKEVQSDVKDMKHGVASLIAHQNAMELQAMFIAEKLVMNCGKNKRG